MSYIHMIPILWPPDAKGWFIRKDPDAGKDWGQKEKRAIARSQHTRPYPWQGHEGENLAGKADQVFQGFRKGQLTRPYP